MTTRSTRARPTPTRFTVTDPGVDTFTVNTPDYPDCGTGGDYVGGSLSTNAGGGSFDCTFPDGPATTDVKIRVIDSDGASDTDTENVVVVESSTSTRSSP